MEGVEDIPGVALHEGLPWSWESFPDYMDFLEKRQFDMDIAAQLPHAALRVYVMGERGANREPATADDILAMKQLTEEAMRAGALGFSSSRTLNHKSSTGDPTPSLTAAKDELVGIGEALNNAGAGVLEMISDFKDIDEEFETLMAMTKAANTSMTISLAQGINPQGWKALLSRIDKANQQGLNIKGQVAPRAIGILMGLNCTLNPFIQLPSYRDIAGLPLQEKVARLQDEAFRAQLLSEQISSSGPALLLTNFDKMWLLGDPPNYEPAPEDSLGAQARRAGVSAESLALDAMLMNDGQQMLYTPFANYAQDNLDCCREMILEENTVMGLGDGGASSSESYSSSYSSSSSSVYFGTNLAAAARRGRADMLLPLPVPVGLGVSGSMNLQGWELINAFLTAGISRILCTTLSN